MSDWHDLSSSWIMAVRVNNDENFLDLRFKDGKICRYEGAKDHFEGIINAGSAGTYFHQNLKNWAYTPVSE